MGGWFKHRADKCVKVAKLRYKSIVTSLERADKKTGWVGKKLIVNLPISVTKWVWMAFLNNQDFMVCYLFCLRIRDLCGIMQKNFSLVLYVTDKARLALLP